MKLFKDLKSVDAETRIRLAKENYLIWKNSDALTEEEKASLDEFCADHELMERVFLTLLEFGTAGIRGKMHMGSSGINRFTVALATKALAYAVKEAKGEGRGVVIACDSRNNSAEFAKITACVLAKEGIKTYIFDRLRPTPELSYAILKLNCQAGVNITASHNTKEYNGYKAYWDNGAQIGIELAKTIADKCYEYDLFQCARDCDFDKLVSDGSITVIGEEVDNAYLGEVLKTSVIGEGLKDVKRELQIVYTPLHGTGYKLVPKILRLAGFENVVTVPEQMVLDGNFPTVKKPNPQDMNAFDQGIALANKVGSEVVLATDPDADRAGIAIRCKDGSFKVLTGNQIGCLLLEFLINAKKKENKLPANSAVVMSLVSTSLADRICKANGIKLFRVYTGFKYIGEKIGEFESSGEYSYLFGFEESHGYLGGTYARDKDAVGAVMLICEMTAFYKSRGRSLVEVMDEIYSKYGFVSDKTYELNITEVDYISKMASIMADFRSSPLKTIDGERVTVMDDYKSLESTDLITMKKTRIELPSENMLSFTTEKSTRIIVRPSGTEPKIKIYVSLEAEDQEAANEKYQRVINEVVKK
ncbi:MAG: phospho-sugar mutase [Ruminococcaceae bacterium]|nr:phospho-sugar mutase [Oscillospiraceae bacterium]